MPLSWTSPVDIEIELQKRWARQHLQRAYLRGTLELPYVIRLQRPNVRELATRFADVSAWIDILKAGAEHYGFSIVWDEVRTRAVGAQRVPRAVSFASLDLLFGAINRSAELAAMTVVRASTRERYPDIGETLAHLSNDVIINAPVWSSVLDVVDFFVRHPRSGRYLRELEIAGIDSKFIEARLPVLRVLLDAVLPDTAIASDARSGSHVFERRYGLRYESPLVRFRILDTRHALAGLRDISAPLQQFVQLDLRVDTVFVTENKMNGLVFPDVPNAIVVFGLGYGLASLFEVEWLTRCAIAYWGDIDTHGFAMLGALRGRFANVRSLLMDEATLLDYRALWSREDEPLRAVPANLSVDERRLCTDLLEHRWGDRVRLEQERVPLARLKSALALDA